MDPKVNPSLLVEAVQDETLVYDLGRHRAHCLNATAGFLLRSADGTRSVAELAAMTEQEFDAPASEEVVSLGLERLRRAKLLEWDGAPEECGQVTRREALKKLAVVGVLLPTVVTLVSPTPAQAATGLPLKDCNLEHVGTCCSNNKLCVQGKTGKFSCAGASCGRP